MGNDNRRRIVEFTQDDRDLITTHSVKLSLLCKRMDDLDDTMQDGFQRILDKMDIQKDFCSDHREKIHGKYFSKKVLMPVLGLIILSLISIGAYSAVTHSEVAVNTSNIERMEKTFKKAESLRLF